jgi:HSP20 family protein
MKTHEKKGNGSTSGQGKSGGASQSGSESMARRESSEMSKPQPQHQRSPSLYAGGGPFQQMREEFDRVFDRFFPGWTGFGEMRSGSAYWGLDIDERDDAVVVRAEAPGFEPGDFDLQVRGNQLTLCACHQEDSGNAEGGKTDGGYHWSRQELSRTVTLPDDVDPEKVEANYRNGVLTVKLPKATPSSSRKIQVKG